MTRVVVVPEGLAALVELTQIAGSGVNWGTAVRELTGVVARRAMFIHDFPERELEAIRDLVAHDARFELRDSIPGTWRHDS